MSKKKVLRPPAGKTSVLPYRIHNQDCITGLAEHVAPGSVQLFFCDPPYNIGWSGYDTYVEDNRPAEEYVGWCQDWLAAAYTALHKHGTLWLAISDEFVSELDVVAKRVGFYKRSHVLWYYCFGVQCVNNFARSHTHLLYYTKTRSRFTFNATDPSVRVPSARQLKYNDKRANPAGKLPDNTWVLHPDVLQQYFGEDRDTWLVSRVCGTFRERIQRGSAEQQAVPQMPEEVLERIIRATSNPGELVCDPFGGTFTTGAVALRLGRTFVGFDISPDYCQQGIERLLRVQKGEKGALRA